MHNGETLQRPFELRYYNLNPFIEITGLNLGIRYKFGG
jgi:hypothetical protein